MASGVQITLNTERKFELGNVTGKDALRRVANLINAALSGTGPEVSDWLIAVRPENIGPSNFFEESIFSRAVQFWTINAATGALDIGTTTIGYTDIDATGVNATDAQLFVDSWNNGGIQNVSIAKATNLVGLLELNNMLAGQTIKIGPYTFTAEEGSGRSTKPFHFRIGGSNADDANNLAYAINTAPGMLSSIRAQSSAAVIMLCIYDDSTPQKFFISTPNPTSVAINSQFANTGRIALVLNQPGFIGTALGWASNGTGLTALGGGGTGQFQGGTGCVMTTQGAVEFEFKDRLTSQTSKNAL